MLAVCFSAAWSGTVADERPGRFAVAFWSPLPQFAPGDLSTHRLESGLVRPAGGSSALSKRFVDYGERWELIAGDRCQTPERSAGERWRSETCLKA
jgi:hypothetical protein